MGNDLSHSVAGLIAMLVAIVVMFGAVGLVAARIDRFTIVDVLWGAGFGVIAVVGFVVSASGDGDTLTRVVLLVAPVLWGLRLAVHNGRRMIGKGEDPRYQAMFDRADVSKTRVAVTRILLPQAGFMAVVALPIVIGQNNTATIWPLVVVGAVVWAVGLFFESVGDAQLQRFRDDPANKGQVMDRGLWHFTRHPNYFGDICNWSGIWIMAAGSWIGLATVVSPVLMAYTIITKTGAAMTEKSMHDSKPGYADYVERTSAIVPLPPKRTTT